MKTRTRTAPALPAKAATTPIISLPDSLTRFSGANRHNRTARRESSRAPDFGPISRAEMREIVLEMIG